MAMKLLGIISVGSDITDLLRMGVQWDGVHFKKAYDSAKSEVLYNILL
jgi:hypothetical protein